MPRSVLCDWGSSHLRAFLDVDGVILDRREGPGIAGLEVPPAVVLREAVEPWRASGSLDQVVMCGMVGSRNGMVEVPYAAAPTGAENWANRSVAHRAGELDVTIAPGICGQNYSGAPEVMRGEETQIFGLFEEQSSLQRGDHLLLLPGTHSKWVEVSNGSIVRFQTFITGELFALLRDRSSLLRAGDSGEDSDTGFADGLDRGSRAGVAEALFETRSAQLLMQRTRGWAGGFLSGVLIGNEVATMLRVGAIRGAVTVVGEPSLSTLYRQALAKNAVEATQFDGDLCAIAGLRLLAIRSKRVN